MGAEARDHVPTLRRPGSGKGAVRQLDQNRYEYIQYMPHCALAMIYA